MRARECLTERLCVCVCVREREREREIVGVCNRVEIVGVFKRERVCVCV